MLRKSLLKYGAIKLTIAFTVFTMVVSVVITILVNLLFTNEWVGFSGLFISILVPALITPTFASVQLTLMSQLYEAEEKLQKQAITDDLTQTYNRRYFIELAEKILDRVQKEGGKFSIIILDMDNFKQINDTYGHLIGDQMLRHFGEICRDFLPDTALLARYGGDEFVFLLRDSDSIEVNKYTETLRQVISQTYLQIGQDKITLRASLGSATFNPHISDLDTLLAQADEAMYDEKRKKGR